MLYAGFTLILRKFPNTGSTFKAYSAKCTSPCPRDHTEEPGSPENTHTTHSEQTEVKTEHPGVAS